MIAFSSPSRDRNLRRMTEKNGASDPATSSMLSPGDAVGGASFTTELASAKEQPSSSRPNPWIKAMELARAGGGSAKITLNIASGESAEIRVTVRNGRVTVLVHVGSRAAEEAIRTCQDTIARGLGETGLRLHQFFVRQPGKHSAQSKLAHGHRRGLPHGSDDEEEQS